MYVQEQRRKQELIVSQTSCCPSRPGCTAAAGAAISENGHQGAAAYITRTGTGCVGATATRCLAAGAAPVSLYTLVGVGAAMPVPACHGLDGGFCTDRSAASWPVDILLASCPWYRGSINVSGLDSAGSPLSSYLALKFSRVGRAGCVRAASKRKTALEHEETEKSSEASQRV